MIDVAQVGMCPAETLNDDGRVVASVAPVYEVLVGRDESLVVDKLIVY